MSKELKNIKKLHTRQTVEEKMAGSTGLLGTFLVINRSINVTGRCTDTGHFDEMRTFHEEGTPAVFSTRQAFILLLNNIFF